MHMLSGRLESIEEYRDVGVSYITLARTSSSSKFITSSADTRR